MSTVESKSKTDYDPELYSMGAAFNGVEIVPIFEARIPLIDMGFLHSDVCYDVVSVWKGSFFRLDDHMDRFEKSYQGLGFKMPYTKEEMRGIPQMAFDQFGKRQNRQTP